MAKKTSMKKMNKSNRSSCPIGMTIDGQARVMIGLVVLVGVMMGFHHGAGWFLLAGFMGLILIITGLSGTCMLRKILCNASWNKNCKMM